MEKVEMETWSRLWIYNTRLLPWHLNPSVTHEDIVEHIPDMCMFHINGWGFKRPKQDGWNLFCKICDKWHRITYHAYYDDVPWHAQRDPG